MHGAGKMFGGLQFALDKHLVDDDLSGDVRDFKSLPSLNLLPHGIEVPLHRVSPRPKHSDDFDFASTGVKSPENAIFEHKNTRYPQVIASRMAVPAEPPISYCSLFAPQALAARCFSRP